MGCGKHFTSREAKRKYEAFKHIHIKKDGQIHLPTHHSKKKKSPLDMDFPDL